MTNTNPNKVVAVELFTKAITVPYENARFAKPKGIFMLQDGDFECEELLDWDGNPFIRINRTKQLVERLKAMNIENLITAYSTFYKFLTQEQYEVRVEELRMKAKRYNDIINRLV